jgi:hypothetical protein
MRPNVCVRCEQSLASLRPTDLRGTQLPAEGNRAGPRILTKSSFGRGEGHSTAAKIVRSPLTIPIILGIP